MWRAVVAWVTPSFSLTYEKASYQVHIVCGLKDWLVLQLQCVFYHSAYFKRCTKSCGGQWWLGLQHNFFKHKCTVYVGQRIGPSCLQLIVNIQISFQICLGVQFGIVQNI